MRLLLFSRCHTSSCVGANSVDHSIFVFPGGQHGGYNVIYINMCNRTIFIPVPNAIFGCTRSEDTTKVTVGLREIYQCFRILSVFRQRMRCSAD